MDINEMYNDVLRQLRKESKKAISLDEVVTEPNKSISISRTKLSEILQNCETMYGLVNKCWSNLPNPPCSEKTYVFVWMMMSEEYGIKIGLEGTDMRWIVGARTCTGYYQDMGMTGPMDEKMYMPEIETLEQIEKLKNDDNEIKFSHQLNEFASYLDFCISCASDNYKDNVDVSELYMAWHLENANKNRVRRRSR